MRVRVEERRVERKEIEVGGSDKILDGLTMTRETVATWTL